jgi:hypothetical protein
MADFRGIDTDEGWINRKFQALQRQIDALRSERRAGATTIGSGGLVVDGGDITALDVDGSVIFRLGPQQHGDRGVTVTREDGVNAIALRKSFSNSTKQTLVLTDANNLPLVAEESLGTGLSYPFLPIPLQPAPAASGAVVAGPWGYEVTHASASWTTAHQAWYARHNQYGLFRLRVAASDATTAGEVRVINVASGLALGGFLSGAWTGVRAAGSTGYTEIVSPGLALPGTAHTSVSIAVQVRRTAGTGSLTVAVPESRGSTP